MVFEKEKLEKIMNQKENELKLKKKDGFMRKRRQLQKKNEQKWSLN